MRLKVIDNAKRFNDMADHWAKDAVEFASSRELFNGVGNDAFGPDRSMTRGMVSTVLARLAGADTAGGETWYAKGTVWAVENGHFRPEPLPSSRSPASSWRRCSTAMQAPRRQRRAGLR